MSVKKISEAILGVGVDDLFVLIKTKRPMI